MRRGFGTAGKGRFSCYSSSPSSSFLSTSSSSYATRYNHPTCFSILTGSTRTYARCHSSIRTNSSLSSQTFPILLRGCGVRSRNTAGFSIKVSCASLKGPSAALIRRQCPQPNSIVKHYATFFSRGKPHRTVHPTTV